MLENGSSVADHAESHVQWILLVGGNNFFRTDVRFRRPFLAGEPRGTMNYSRETPRIWDDYPLGKEQKKDTFSSRYISAFWKEQILLISF